jgi:uncharacterized protein YndB with AHSA1/START domain
MTTDATARSVAHHTFAIERTYPHPVEAVWHAFADADAHFAWFGSEETFTDTEKSDDFRVGGRTVQDGHWHNGPRSRFVNTYTDIVERERIVGTYDMWVDGTHISTSLTTTTFEPVDGGTRLTFVEQGVYLDGFDDGSMRETGTQGILDTLGTYLDQA